MFYFIFSNTLPCVSNKLIFHLPYGKVGFLLGYGMDITFAIFYDFVKL
jgi:hypothetical protein